jgi:DNA-binding transcriptional LysR family regulator
MQPLIETDLLATFVAIADAGGFTEAAARIGRTQSAVSMQMRRLEERLGGPLFLRAGRGVILSPRGEQLLPHARRLLRANREVVAAFSAGALDGRLRLGAPDDYASTFLPPVLARLALTHPRVEVDMLCATSADLIAAIAAGGLDLAIVTAGSGERDATLLRREPLVWVGHPGHPAHERDPLPLAVFHPGCLFRRAALDALGGAGRASRIAYTSLSDAGVVAAVRAGLAVGVLARSTVPEGLVVLGPAAGLPPLPEVGIAMVRAPSPATALRTALEAAIAEALSEPAALAPAA